MAARPADAGARPVEVVPPMSVTFRSVADYGIEPAADLAGRGFADYLVPISITAAGLLAMVRQDSVDPGASRVVLDDGRPVGVALIARRGWTSRLAAMSVLPEARGRGVGDACVRQLLAEAAARGERAMTLEVIEGNERAVRLYERRGFRTVRRLVGYAGRPTPRAAPADLRAVDPREAARAVSAHAPADLPWQLSGETLAQSGPPGVAYRTDEAWIACSDPSAPTVVLRALVTERRARGRGAATALLAAVAGLHAGRDWRVPAIWPEELAGPLARAGLVREALSQRQMTIELPAETRPTD